MNRVLKCPMCGEEKIFRAKVTLGHRGDYIFCTGCGGGVLYPKPKVGKVVDLYKTSKYFNLLSKPVSNPLLQWILTRKIYETPAEWVLEKFPGKGAVLDVGCGSGEFLGVLKKNGWEVYGSDISREAVERTRDRLREINNIKIGEFSGQKFNAKFNLISFWHVLEHLTNPFAYMRKARSLLEAGGRIAGEMPNFDSLALKIFGRDYAWIMVPDHLVYFSRKSLKKVFKRTDLKVVNFYFPPRALLNFSISLRNYLKGNKAPHFLYSLIYVLSIPFSVLFIVLASAFGRGEVIRFVAGK